MWTTKVWHACALWAICGLLGLGWAGCSDSTQEGQADAAGGTGVHIPDAARDAGHGNADTGVHYDGSVDAARPADTGAESEPADTGGADTGSADAGIDAGMDTGAPADAGTDAAVDAGRPDGGADAGAADTGYDAGEIPDCSTPDAAFDYTCDMTKPETCPGGICAYNWCIGPVLDNHQWDNCGNGACDVCEAAGSCPADCGQKPAMTGTKSYDNATTISIWVHGFSNTTDADRKKMTFGENGGCSGVFGDMGDMFGFKRPCGDANPTAPNQFTKVEYYGDIPPSWMSQADANEIAQYPWEGTTGIRRYGLIVAKYIRHVLDASGATHVNLACHSMGCYITRHMIENDLEHLASENRFVRWHTSAGVLAGARLARLYDNPQVQQTAALIGISQWDFLIMNPDLVQETTAVWDHNLWEGNNPLFGGMIIHHTGATDPRIAQALNIQLLDLKNPGDEPNDGIMYTLDEFFHDQKPDAAFTAPDGTLLKSSHNYVYVDHMTVPSSEASVLIGMATLFHARKVRIEIKELEVYKDHESHAPFDGEHGTPPADIAAEVEVRFNPYVQQTWGKDILVHQATVAQRSPELFNQDQGAVTHPAYTIFEGPILDGMTELSLNLSLREVDWYPRFNVKEWSFNASDEMAAFNGQVPLTDHDFEVKTDYVRMVVGTDQYVRASDSWANERRAAAGTCFSMAATPSSMNVPASAAQRSAAPHEVMSASIADRSQGEAPRLSRCLIAQAFPAPFPSRSA